MVGEGGGGAEHAEQPVAQGFGGDEGVEQFVPVGGAWLRLQQPYESQQGEIGVGGGGEGLQQDGIAADRHQFGTLEQPLGGGRIGETVPQQPSEGSAPAPRRRHPGLLLSTSCGYARHARHARPIKVLRP